jgi:hypothetical protein
MQEAPRCIYRCKRTEGDMDVKDNGTPYSSAFPVKTHAVRFAKKSFFPSKLCSTVPYVPAEKGLSVKDMQVQSS